MRSTGAVHTAVSRLLPTCALVLSSFASDEVEKHCLRLGADVVCNKAHTAAFLGWVQRVAVA